MILVRDRKLRITALFFKTERRCNLCERFRGIEAARGRIALSKQQKAYVLEQLHIIGPVTAKAASKPAIAGPSSGQPSSSHLSSLTRIGGAKVFPPSREIVNAMSRILPG